MDTDTTKTKTIKCNDMGGDCDEPITGTSAEDVINKGMAHVNEAHPELAAKISAMPKEQTDQWSADFMKKWDETPHNEDSTEMAA